MGDQRALDLERRHPDAGYLEHVVAAAAERVAPFRVAHIFIAGAGPVALERLTAFAALVPVALAGGGRIDQQFADLAIGNVLAGFIDKPNPVAWHRTSRRAVFDIAGRIRQKDMQQLGRADTIENIDPESRVPGVADRFRQRLTGRGTYPQPRAETFVLQRL